MSLKMGNQTQSRGTSTIGTIGDHLNRRVGIIKNEEQLMNTKENSPDVLFSML